MKGDELTTVYATNHDANYFAIRAETRAAHVSGKIRKKGEERQERYNPKCAVARTKGKPEGGLL